MYKVALVDDDEWILKGIEHTFEWDKYGFCVAAKFTEPNDLLEYLKTNTVSVIFTDIKMMDMTGLELIDKVKNGMGFKNIIFVIISAYDDYDFMREAIKLGVADYCRKPILRSAAEKIMQDLKLKLDLPQRSKTENLNDEKGDMPVHEGLQKIIDYINGNLEKRLTLTDAASRFGYNASYVSSLFKVYLNTGFSEYLMAMRMKKAKELFDTKKYSIKEVQTFVGYADYSYFHSTFTKYYGITPSKYLKGEDKSTEK